MATSLRTWTTKETDAGFFSVPRTEAELRVYFEVSPDLERQREAGTTFEEWLADNERRDLLNATPQTAADWKETHIPLQRNGEDALVFQTKNETTPFVVAHGYDEETGHWSHGTYHSSITSAVADLTGSVITDASDVIHANIWSRQDVIDALASHGLPGREDFVEKVLDDFDVDFLEERLCEVGNDLIGETVWANFPTFNEILDAGPHLWMFPSEGGHTIRFAGDDEIRQMFQLERGDAESPSRDFYLWRWQKEESGAFMRYEPTDKEVIARQADEPARESLDEIEAAARAGAMSRDDACIDDVIGSLGQERA